MNVIYINDIEKMNVDRKRSLERGVNKLASLADNVSVLNQMNNPIVHDTYGDGFYAYKYAGPKCSIRILYRIIKNKLEIHMWSFKCGRKDGSSYINEFEDYVKEYKKTRL